MLLTVIDYLVIAPEDSIFADLDNKGASVPCNSSGSTTSEQSVETHVSMYKGNDKQTITAIACKIGESYGLSSEYASASTPSPAQNFKVSVTPSTGYVKVFVKSGTSMSSPTVITITVTATVDGESVSRDVILTISGNKAGAKGDDAVTYTISLAGSTFARDPNTDLIYVDIKGVVYKTIGGTTSLYTGLSRSELSLYFLHTDDSQDPVPSQNNLNLGFTVSNGHFYTKFYNNTGYDDEKAFVAVLNGKWSASIQIEKYGTNGASVKGDTGRMFYIAGKFPEKAPYYRTSVLCPIVFHGTEWWYLDADSATSSDIPSDGSQKWKKVENFGVVITEAIFVKDFAQFGAAVITGDWLISCHGTIGGAAYGGTVENPDNYLGQAAYTWFDPQSPNGNTRPFTIPLTNPSVNIPYSTGWTQITDKFSLMGNATYLVKIKAKVSNTSYAGHIRIAYGAGVTDGTDFIYVGGTTSNLETEITKTFSLTLPTAKDFRFYAATDNSSCTITISSITIERKDNNMFVPNYAVDLKTGRSYQNAASFSSVGSTTRIEILEGVIRFYGTGGFANIELGVDANGCAVLNFYDKDGNYKYGLGPDTIIGEMDSVPNSWGSVGAGGLAAFDLSQNWSLGLERSLPNLTTSSYYKFTEGYTKLNSVKKYNISQDTSPSAYNNKCYDSKNMSGTAITANPTGGYIPSGYYVGKEMMMATGQELIGSTEGIYSRRCYSVSNNGSVPVYLGTLYYHKDSSYPNNTWLTDKDGNKLSCSTSKTFLYYIESEFDPVL